MKKMTMEAVTMTNNILPGILKLSNLMTNSGMTQYNSGIFISRSNEASFHYSTNVSYSSYS